MISGPSVVSIYTERTHIGALGFVLSGDVSVRKALDVADNGIPVDRLIQICRQGVAGSFGQHGRGSLNFRGIKSEK